MLSKAIQWFCTSSWAHVFPFERLCIKDLRVWPPESTSLSLNPEFTYIPDSTNIPQVRKVCDLWKITWFHSISVFPSVKWNWKQHRIFIYYWFNSEYYLGHPVFICIDHKYIATQIHTYIGKLLYVLTIIFCLWTFAANDITSKSCTFRSLIFSK